MDEHKKMDFKKIFGQITNTKGLVIILMIGVILLIVSGGISRRQPRQAQTNAAQSEDTDSYREGLEQRLCAILSSMQGVGTVEVMITLEDTGQDVLAYDEKQQTKGAAGAQAASATGVQDKQTDSKVVLKSEGGSQTPVKVREMLPQVSGVLVVAEGGGEAAVKNEIINAVRAVLNVRPNKVCVVNKK